MHRRVGSDNSKYVRKEINTMLQLAHATPQSEQDQPEPVPVVTTLGKLIETVNEEVEPEEDYLVSSTVLDLLNTCRIRFLNP